MKTDSVAASIEQLATRHTQTVKRWWRGSAVAEEDSGEDGVYRPGVGDRDGQGAACGLVDGEADPGAVAEVAGQAGALPADADRLPPPAMIPVDGVQLEIAAVRRAEAELDLDLIGVVVRGRSTRALIGTLKRPHIARVRPPHVARTLRHARRHPRHRDHIIPPIPRRQVIPRPTIRTNPTTLRSAHKRRRRSPPAAEQDPG